MADTLTVNIDSQGSTINPSNTTLTSSATTPNSFTAVNGVQATITTIGIQGASAAASPLSENSQVDIVAEGLNNGSMLVYKTSTAKWTSTKTLDLQIVDSGEF